MSEPLVVVELGGGVDAESAFLAVHASDENAFWLDAGPSAREGWSWVGCGTAETDARRVREVDCAVRADRESWVAGPFRGGWIGWLGYDEGAAAAGAPAVIAADGVPQELWLRVERFVAFDHSTRRAWAVAPEGAVHEYAATIMSASSRGIRPPAAPAPVQAHARHSATEYAVLIERCRGAIREGDAYQLCLTTRFAIEAAFDEDDAVETYRRLRAASPAHHGGLVRSGGVALAGASPERFLDVADGIVRTRPIKGTRPRGRDPVADAASAEELRANAKERAENVMIVDLMRNDLSRVCEPGSVAVDALLEVESYSAVHQLVSTVSGTLRAGTTVGALLEATFPAGSMTGAPKLSAMTILRDLERAPRGVFAGCFGWVGEDGALDLAMVIRSIVVHPRGAYVGAGGGITWRSDPAAEVAEVGVKARGPLGALGAVLPPGW